MNNIKNCFLKTAFSCLFLAVSLISVKQAIADQRSDIVTDLGIIYQPPADQTRPSSETTTSGTRGGCEDFFQGKVPLTPLAPRTHVAQTALMSPTLAWYLPEHKISVPTKVSIWSYDDLGNISEEIHSIELITKTGINQVSLKEESIELLTGQTYLWVVEIDCDVETDPLASTDITIVTKNVSLDYRWYDLLDFSLNNSQDITSTITLLNSLIQVEKRNLSENIGDRKIEIETEHHIYVLTQIRDILLSEE